MVVLVLMTSCHVSEKPKSGPVNAHMTMRLNARIKAQAEPVTSATLCANFRNSSFMLTPGLAHQPWITSRYLDEEPGSSQVNVCEDIGSECSLQLFRGNFLENGRWVLFRRVTNQSREAVDPCQRFRHCPA